MSHTSHANDVPSVSIITVTLNAVDHIERCLKSVLSQPHPKIQHIIFDGGSTDGTVDILKKYDSRIHFWKSEPDSGIFNAMNKALNHAKGDWIFFLGADDFLYPGFSEMATHLKHQNVIYHGHCLWGNMILGGKYDPYRLTKDCICHHSILYPRKVFQKYRYDENYKVNADYLLNIQCWNDKTFKKQFIPFLIANFSKGGFSEQATDHLFIKDFKRIIRRYSNTLTYIRHLYFRYRKKTE